MLFLEFIVFLSVLVILIIKILMVIGVNIIGRILYRGLFDIFMKDMLFFFMLFGFFFLFIGIRINICS